MHPLIQGSNERMELEKKLLLHQSEAAAGIKLQKDQKLMALTSGGTPEVLQIDYMANPRTLLTNLSDSFYN